MSSRDEQSSSSARVYSLLAEQWAVAEPEIKLLHELCPGNSLAIDVGAHRGLYTWFLLQLTNNIVAFEPMAAMQTLLRKIYGNSITLEAVALSDRSGEYPLRIPISNPALATISTNNKLQAGARAITTLITRTMTLDSFEYRNVGFIKIDVEGHEEAVLRGARTTLVRDMPNLIIEIEERHAPGSTAAVPEFLEKIGYAGCYVDTSRVVDIADFVCDRDQPLGNISGGTKIGRYINNFVFVRGATAREMFPKLQRAIDLAGPVQGSHLRC
jgi:FkbM family methyltransferase